MTTDVNGAEIQRGSKVRILSIDPKLLHTLPQDEFTYVQSMVGSVYEVLEVSEPIAYVEAVWAVGAGQTYSSKLAMRSTEIELVE